MEDLPLQTDEPTDDNKQDAITSVVTMASELRNSCSLPITKFIAYHKIRLSPLRIIVKF